MKKLLAAAVACVCALGLFADEGPIYLKANATGTGDGSSWENAMTSARDAIVLADTSGRPVYAARGYYKVSSGYTLTKGLAIYGGFPGASMSETLADRDPAKYQTIFTSASNKPDIKWNHAAPQSGQFKISVAALDAAANPVFVQDEDGYDVFNPPPAPEGEFDGYYISGGNNVTMVTVAKDTGLAADGIWFIGLANGYPFTIQAINDNCGVRTISNCRFFGSRGPFTTNSGHDNKDILTVRISNCEFRYTYNLKPVVQTYGRHTIIEDCAFSDHFRTDVKDGCNVIWVWYINATIRGCSFARCAAVTQSSGESDTNYNGTNLIGWNAANVIRLEDCTMSNNVSMAQYGYGCSLFGCKGASLCNLTVVNNRLEVKARAAGTYSLVTGSLRCPVAVGYENCLFASNTVAEVVGDADTYALGILGNGIEKNNVNPIVNCTFIDNEVTTVGSAASVIRSQGVLFNDSAAANSRMAVVNCTFARSQEDAGIYDVAQYGSAINDFYVINSISMRGPNAQFDPFYAETPSKFKVRSCTVGGYLAVPDWLDAEEISSDAVPLEWLALGGGRAALRPACRLGSLRESVDVSVCTRTANVIEPEERAYYTSYMIRNDADTGWISLTGETAPKTALGLLADATDTEERPAGSFTRGPVQALSASAEAGNTLVVKSEPYGAGVYTPDYWQVVAPGEAPAAVTAAAANPDLAMFDHWVTAGGEVTSNPLMLGVLPEGVTTVTAVFAVPTKKMTFDLGEYGTFEDGSTRCEVEMMPGTPLVIPAFTVSDDWVLTGWSPAIPAKVPAEATTFTATAVTKLLRVIRLAPADDPVAAGGKGDGSSWADAYRGDFAAAYADAAAYRGEVWIKKGAYNVTSTVFLKSRVRVIGGFAGDETSADAADPEANPAILTGDVYHDNYWKVNAGNTSAGVNVIDYENLAFNEPQPADRETYWAANGNNGDDTATCFIGNEPLTECVLEGITLTCFKGTTIQTENSSPVKLVKCRFLANNTGLSLGAEHGAFVARGTVEAEDCDFYAMHTPLAILDGGVAYTDPIRLTRCRFRFNHGYGSGTGGGFSMETGNRDLIIEGCEFTDNFGFEYQGYQRCPVQVQLAKSITMRDTLVARNTYKNRCVAAFDIENVNGGIFISNCVFRGNQKIAHGNDSGQRAAALRIVRCPPWNDATQSYIRDTLFESNSVVRQAECNTGTDHTLHQASALQTSYGLLAIVNCSFVDNSCEVREGTTVAAGSSAATVQIGRNNGNSHTFFLNCIFSGNVVAGEAASEVAMATSTAGNPIAFVNSVFDGSKTPNYEPFAYVNANPDLPFMAAHCRITGYTPEKYASQIGTYGFDIGNSAEMPTIAKAIATGANGISALPVRGTAKQGVPVYLAPDGFYYLHLPEYNAEKPYLRLKTSITAMPVATLPAGAVANADAFGVAPTNRKARPSLGPVNDKNGLLLQVK